jgi:hypothetical protein
MGVGLGIWGWAATVSIVGAAMIIHDATSGCNIPVDREEKRSVAVGVARQADIFCAPKNLSGTGFTLLTVGQAASLAGIPLFVLGNEKVTHEPKRAARFPELRLGVASATVGWLF